jgi:hypothetical protein
MTVRVDIAPELLLCATERARQDVDALERGFPSLDVWLQGTRQPTLR